MSSHGVPIGTRVEHEGEPGAEEPRGGKISFTVFTDKEVVHTVSPRLLEQEIRKRFNPKLPAGTSCKIGKTWFEIDVESSKKIPLLGTSLGQRKILMEWYKTEDGTDKWKLTSWEAFWTNVRRCASLATM